MQHVTPPARSGYTTTLLSFEFFFSSSDRLSSLLYSKEGGGNASSSLMSGSGALHGECNHSLTQQLRLVGGREVRGTRIGCSVVGFSG